MKFSQIPIIIKSAEKKIVRKAQQFNFAQYGRKKLSRETCNFSIHEMRECEMCVRARLSQKKCLKVAFLREKSLVDILERTVAMPTIYQGKMFDLFSLKF